MAFAAGQRLGEQVTHQVPVYVGKTEIAALVTISQTLVVDSRQVQNGRVQVMDVHGAWRPVLFTGLRFEWVSFGIRNVVGIVIRLPVSNAGFHTTTSQPHCKAARMVVAAIVFFLQPSLAVTCLLYTSPSPRD